MFHFIYRQSSSSSVMKNGWFLELTNVVWSFASLTQRQCLILKDRTQEAKKKCASGYLCLKIVTSKQCLPRNSLKQESRCSEFLALVDLNLGPLTGTMQNFSCLLPKCDTNGFIVDTSDNVWTPTLAMTLPPCIIVTTCMLKR